MNIKKIIEYTNSKHPVNWGLIICLILFYFISIKQGYNLGVAFACFPLVLITLNYSFKNPLWIFLLLFTVNYFIMGINRYMPITSSAYIDSLFILTSISIVIKNFRDKFEWGKVINPLSIVTFIWLFFCTLELINPNSVGFIYWATSIRAIAVYPLITVILVSLLFKKYKHINWLLILWATLTLLGAAKGYWQKNHGFDPTEINWLYFGGGATTHLLTTGIRFFSFFTDAGNYGSSMGLSMVVFSIASIFIKNRWLKLLFIITAIAGGYGMIISGTRGALAVPFTGYALFIILSKKWKLAISGGILLVASFFVLNFTVIGNNNRLIHRMRTAFDTNDASFQVRLNNQKIMKKYMTGLPFGAGIGLTKESVPSNSKLVDLATMPKDSSFVRIWVYTGPVGLTIYLFLLILTIIWGSYILLFKIKNEELRGILAGMLAGTFGMMVSAYGNEIYSQFPNGILIYTCQALVFLAPYFDKELEKKKLTTQS